MGQQAERRAEQQLPTSVRRFLVAMALARLGAGLVLPYTLIYLHEVRDQSLTTVGTLLAVPGLVGLLAVPVAGAQVDRVGPRRVLVVAQLMQASGAVVLAVGTSAAVFAPGLLLYGIGAAAFFPASSAMVNALSDGPDMEQRAFAFSFSAGNVAIGVGSLTASLVVDLDRTSTFVAVFLANALCELLAIVWLPPSAPRQAAESDVAAPSYREVWGDPLIRRVCGVALVLAVVGYASTDSGVPAFARVEGHVSPRVIGLVFVVNTMTILALQLFALKVMAGRRRSAALALAAGIWACSWALLGLVSVGSEWSRVVVVLAYGGLFGLGEVFMAPTLFPMVNALASDRLRGRYNGALSLMFSIGFVVAPPVAAGLIGHGLGMAWLTGMVVAAGLASVVCHRLGRVLTNEQDGLVPEQERVPVPLTSGGPG